MLNSSQIQILGRSLDAATLRQRITLNNIANVDTPQFKSKHVVFEDILQQELSTSESRLNAYMTNSRHIPFGFGHGAVPAPQIVSNSDSIIQNNGNNVDIDAEMSLSAKNQIWYDGLVQFTNGYFSKLKSVIDGGR